MKIALLISGYLRGFTENILNIKKNIIQTHDCDIYIHITENEVEDKYLNKQISSEFIKKELNPKLLIISKNFVFSNDKNINNLLNQNYKLYWLNEERKRISIIENIVYGAVIKFRPDINIQTPIIFDDVLNSIFVPVDSKIDISKLSNKDDKYICDIMAYGNPIIMDKYFNYYLKINDLIDKHGTSINETLLYYYLNNEKIDYIYVDIKYIVILSLCNIIAITGDSGCGKTTVSNILKNIFNSSFLLECDRYHKWERDNENWKNFTHLNPNANYITKMCQDVFDLKIGSQIYQVDYNHSNGKFTDKELIEPKENIILCGLHCLYAPENIIDLKIYIDTDENLRIPWKINRDVKKRGYSIEKIYKQIEHRKLDFYTYIYPQREIADIIINFYTDKKFEISTFDMNEQYNVYLKISIKMSHNLKNINDFIRIDKIEKDENFINIYFLKSENYEEIIKNVILCMIM